MRAFVGNSSPPHFFLLPQQFDECSNQIKDTYLYKSRNNLQEKLAKFLDKYNKGTPEDQEQKTS